MKFSEESIRLFQSVSPRIDELIEEFRKEGDRAAVILGTARLEDLLYQLLVKFLLPHSGSRDDLFDGDAPLSTLSAKINMCYRLGLIDDDFARDLHLVRKIRNSFAHEFSSKNLDIASHRDRVRLLVAPIRKTKTYLYQKERAGYEEQSEAAVDFRLIISIMATLLELQINAREQIKYSFPPASLKLIPLAEKGVEKILEK